MTFEDFYDYLLNLCDKLSHETDEQAETIDEQAHEINTLYKEIEQQKTEINRLKMVIELKDDARIELVKESKELQRIIDVLQTDLANTSNDYKQASNEIRLLNERIDKLILENNDLKHRRKILVKHLLNIMYGFDYAVKDSINVESEDK